MKNMTARIRAAKTWKERADIAADKFPTTNNDFVFENYHAGKTAKELGMKGNLNAHIHALGAWLYNLILAGDSKRLRRLALDLDDWKWHKPKPDHDLIVFCWLMHSFPPGGARVKFDPKTKHIVPNGVYGQMTIEDLMRELDRQFPDHVDDRPRYDEAIRKKFKRYAEMFGVKLVNEREPRLNKSGHNQRKRV